MNKGGCECGAVRFVIDAPLSPPVACHCSQCRRTSGHVWAGTLVDDAALTITGEEALRWYRSSGFAQRGFCGTCGSSLFYRMDGEGKTSVAAGALDTPTGTRLAKHIFVKDKSDYYDIVDGLPALDRF